MLVYRSVESIDDAGRMLDDVRAAVAAISPDGAPHEACVDALLSSAELETAVLDARFDRADDIEPAERACRRVTELSAEALIASSRDDRTAVRTLATRLSDAVRSLRILASAGAVRRKIPEGFAYYAVYPELYAEAAARLARERQPDCVTVVGIRTIGAALSAAAVAGLRAEGVSAESCTVRPRGHPFDRRIAVTPRMRAWLDGRARGWFAIADEGPGISGSSFAAVSRFLCEIGAPDERIVLFPSWLPQTGALCNAEARRRWDAHEKFVVSFEQSFVHSCRLARGWAAAIESDWSGGRWRDALYDGRTPPPAQPQHEQRKFIVRTPDGARRLLKFVGLGRYGRARRDVAQRLAEAILGPRVLGLFDGFLAMEFIDGSPSSAEASRRDIEALAAYVARRRASVESRRSSIDIRDLSSATRINVSESLGDAWAERACIVVQSLGRPPGQVAVDGRMQPHEWIRAGSSLIKTDGIAHHDDHFLQPPCDPVWDLAGASVEWSLDAAQEMHLLRAYVSQSDDATAPTRFPPCCVAYLAHRIGYASMAAATLGDTPDGRGMRALTEQYASQLRSRLETA